MAEVAIEKPFEIEVRDLEYQRTDGVPLLARLYRPIRPGNSGGSFPAVIDVHGGAWASGDRLNNAPLDEALAKRGIVVLAIDFRMPPQHRYPASIAARLARCRPRSSCRAWPRTMSHRIWLTGWPRLIAAAAASSNSTSATRSRTALSCAIRLPMRRAAPPSWSAISC